jgi:hypothetical protein
MVTRLVLAMIEAHGDRVWSCHHECAGSDFAARCGIANAGL